MGYDDAGASLVDEPIITLVTGKCKKRVTAQNGRITIDMGQEDPTNRNQKDTNSNEVGGTGQVKINCP